MPTRSRLVFLDADTLPIPLRAPAFPHDWIAHPHTAPAQVVERLQGARIAITNKVALRREALARLPDLRMVAIAATGTDNVDLDACAEHGIVVSNIRGYAGASVPEHTLSLILALRRNLRAYADDVAQGAWERSPHFCLHDHPIRDLAGSRLGIVGYGTLGRAVARLGRAFGMEIAVASRRPVDEPGTHTLALDALLASSDVVTLHLPLTPDTRHLIGARELARMKPDALLINTARGGLVDEAALADALRAGRLGGAGFDVVDGEPPRPGNPLLALRQSNLIVTPHVAWASQQAMRRLADQLIDNLDAFARGEPRNRVDAR